MRKFFLLLAAAVVLLSSLALAESGSNRVRITGHIKPLPREQLAQPIRLSCGVVIEEWRGASIDAAARGKVERLCNEAKAYFPVYIKKYGGYRVSQASLDNFSFQFALLPDNEGYRSLNDTKYRFWNRPYRGTVFAYASHTDQFVFMLSDTTDYEFSDTFVHETYHALSFKTGLFAKLPGDTYRERLAIDESMAQDFTRRLGY
jgi:hypothetical protein